MLSCLFQCYLPLSEHRRSLAHLLGSCHWAAQQTHKDESGVTRAVSVCHLSGEVVVQVSFLVLGPQHVHDLPVFRCACGTFGLTLGVALKAVLVEGVTAQEVNRGQLEGAVAHAALVLLENLCAVREKKYKLVQFHVMVFMSSNQAFKIQQGLTLTFF